MPSPHVPIETMLEVAGLSVSYQTDTGDIPAVIDIDLTVLRGETLGIIGESGCGKSTAAYAMLRLLQPPGRVVGGSVSLEGTDLLTLSEDEMRRRRWRDVALIPQGAMNSLNPTMTVGQMFAATFRAHDVTDGLPARTLSLLARVGLELRVVERFPHELSGGMKQRVCIALAIALDPQLVIADEPTSALDVVVQRTVCQTLLRIKQELALSMVIIGHDLGLMAQMADRIAVMYAGKVVEAGAADEIIARPQHPYTRILVQSVSDLRQRRDLGAVGRPDAGGIMHDPRYPPSGCIFRLRCPLAQDVCTTVTPQWRAATPLAGVACHFAADTGAGT